MAYFGEVHRRKIWFFVGCFLIPLSALSAAGTAGAQFLKMGAGARAAAMGNAFASIADDVTATYWNPAGLSQIKSAEVAFMHNDGLVDTQYQYFGGALPRGRHAIGLAIYRLDFGSIDRYSAADDRDGSFDAGSFASGVTWSSRIRDSLYLGSTLKYLRESLDNENASTFAGDLGALFKKNQFNFSVSLQHLGPKIKFIQEKESLPQTLRLGVSGRFLKDTVQVACNYSRPKDNDGTIHLGTEYRATKQLFLRGGYQVTPGNNIDVDGLTNISGGIGVQISQFSVDYAFLPFGDLGDTHRISLLFRFKKG